MNRFGCCVCSVVLVMCLGFATAQEPAVREVIEYITVQERACDGGVCRIVNVQRPVRRLVSIPAQAVSAVVSSLADVATAQACGCGCGLDGCDCGLAVAGVVNYAEIERVSGLRFAERVRQRLFWRRQGRNRAVANFSSTGVNTRLRGLSMFFPRAWFNLR